MRTTLEVSELASVVNPPDWMRQKIREQMTLPNPQFTEAQKHGRFLGHLAPELKYFDDYRDTISFLRGYARTVAAAMMAAGVAFDVEDRRRTLEPLPLEFKGTLRPYQQAAVVKALERDHGVIQAPTGSGKTVVALAIIARRQQPTLILCHTRELADQWQARIEQFLNVKAGMVGGGKFGVAPVTVGLFQTVKNHLDKLPQRFGHVVVDECHRAPAESFNRCVTAFDARYLLGLTATGYRRDGLGRLICLLMGDQVHQVDRADLEKQGAILRPEIITRQTSFEYCYQDDYPAMIEALTTDRERNRLIVADVESSQNGTGAALVVSDRVDHLGALAGMLRMDRQAVLTGRTPKAERARIVDGLNQGKVKVLFSTTALISEGFDCPGLHTLHLATPLKFKGRVVQAVGRILRPAPGKRATVYDYQDTRQPILAAAARARLRALKELGNICNDNSGL